MDWGLADQEGIMRQRFAELDEATRSLRRRVAESDEGWEAFQETYDISLIFHENGLEGVVLSYPEIKSAVDNRIISDVSLLPTYQHIKNQKYCLDLIREKAATKRFNVTIGFLKELHTRLVDNPEEAAVYRKDIPIHRTYFHEIAQPSKIHAELLKVLEYLRTKPPKEMHPIEFASIVHHRFMRVFPFSNHSGFIGRFVCNFVLMRAGYLPVIIHASDRQRYYEALRAPERDYRQFVVEAMENSIDNVGKFFFSAEARREVREVHREARA